MGSPERASAFLHARRSAWVECPPGRRTSGRGREGTPLVCSAPSPNGAPPTPATTATFPLIPYRPVPGEAGHRLLSFVVRGTCLQPFIPDGATVVVDSSVVAEPGRIVVVACEGAVNIKVMARDLFTGEVTLRSFEGDVVPMDQLAAVVGVVVAFQYVP